MAPSQTPAKRVECEIVHFFFYDRRCDKRANSEKDFTIEAISNPTYTSQFCKVRLCESTYYPYSVVEDFMMKVEGLILCEQHS
jgi:hypothetical protein